MQVQRYIPPIKSRFDNQRWLADRDFKSYIIVYALIALTFELISCY
jgi:hypothetical protein